MGYTWRGWPRIGRLGKLLCSGYDPVEVKGKYKKDAATADDDDDDEEDDNNILSSFLHFSEWFDLLLSVKCRVSQMSGFNNVVLKCRVSTML